MVVKRTPPERSDPRCSGFGACKEERVDGRSSRASLPEGALEMVQRTRQILGGRWASVRWGALAHAVNPK